jgi:SH3-like domain-containing protein
MHPLRMHALCLVFVFVASLAVSPPVLASSGSGLPLPRFVSLRAAEANMRTGPGEQYPIKWTYRRPGLPLEVVKEYHHWRWVRDWQGAEGWMHSSMLSGKRSIIITGQERTLRAKPNASSPIIARIEDKVVGRLRACPRSGEWCRVEFNRLQGWLLRTEMWGVYDDEEVG